MRRRWLGTLLLAPLLLGGCGTSGAEAGTVPSPSGSPWVVVAAGNAIPSPGPSQGRATPRPFASGFLPLRSINPTAAPRPAGTPCPPSAHHSLNFASVVPGPTSAVVTWYNPGGNDLVEYRVTAISQDLQGGTQPEVGWTVVKPPAASCGFISARVTGLSRTTDYVFSVDAVRTRLGRTGTRAVTVARSQVSRTT